MAGASSFSAESKYLEYLDLLIEIGEKIGQNRYHLSMTGDFGGKVEGVFELQVSEMEIGSVVRTLSLGARLARAKGSSVFRILRGTPPERLELRAFGQKLFDGLMHSSEVQSYYGAAVRTMQAGRNKGLRLRLVMEDPSLQAIPWELLHDGDRFLAVSGLTPLVRYSGLDIPMEQSLEVKPPLRLLVVIASPGEQVPLDVDREQRVIEQALRRSGGLIAADLLLHASYRALGRKLSQAEALGKPYHVLHFICHGEYRANASQLLFERDDNARKSDYISGEELGNLIQRYRQIRLAVLNACERTWGGRGDPFSCVALSLIKTGVPAVVVMRFPMSDQAATRFSDEFYYSLALGFPVDVALGDARIQMYAIEGSVEFVTPVLYMQAPEGRLFDVTDLPQPAVAFVEERTEQRRLDKDKGELGGTMPSPAQGGMGPLTGRLGQLNWEMIGALAGVVSVIVTIVALLISMGDGKPTPSPSHTSTPTETVSGEHVARISPTASLVTLLPADTPMPALPLTPSPSLTATPLSPASPSPAPTPTSPLPPSPTFTPTPIPTSSPTLPPSPTFTPTLTPTSSPTLLPSPRGKIAFVSDRDGDAEIFVMNEDRTGLQQITQNPWGDRQPNWSPDGTQIVFTREGHGVYHDVYVMNADGSEERPLVDHQASDMWPAWSPKGEWIAFQSNRNRNWDIYLVKADGSGLRQLTTHAADDQMPAWSPDGTRVVFQSNRGGVFQIYSVNTGGQQETHHVPSGFNYWGPKFSPRDGRLVFYSPDQAGNWEVYVEVEGQPWRVTDAVTEEKIPAWSPDGGRIAFVSSSRGKFDIFVVLLDDVLSRGPGGAPWAELATGPGNNEDPAWWGSR